ncbi:hypothetical protein PV392_27515 [Streptomyces sp. ME03-5709C]|nr:hypothetical protein [Streptomyces sp. ME03-5709C]
MVVFSALNKQESGTGIPDEWVPKLPVPQWFLTFVATYGGTINLVAYVMLGLSILAALFVFVALFSDIPAERSGISNRTLSWRMGWLLAALRYALVMEIAETVIACAEAHRAGGERLAPKLRKVSRRMGAVTRGVGTAHRQRKSVPLFSHRRRALKAHERQVIAALRTCEARVDSDPRPALEELAVLLMTVADRYCQGRVGALLDDAQLQGVSAGPDRDWVRVLVWAVLTAGAVIGVSFAGLSDGAEPIVMTLAAVFVAAAVFRRNVLRFFDLISLVQGGP